LPGIGNRTHAHHGVGIGRRIARVELGVEFLEAVAVETGITRPAARARRVRPQRKPAHALDDVLIPADRLAVFAVADDIDADLPLAADHFGDRIPQAALIGRGIVGLPRLLCPHDLLEGGRPDQAADMRGEDALAARSHDISRRSWIW